jgi:hypothetical protein
MNCKLLKFDPFTYKIILIMKKILASIATVVALTGFAAGSHAAGDNTGAGGSSTAANYNSVHSGGVSATCSLKVDDGALPTNAGLVSNLVSSVNGKIATVCNNATSKLDVTIDASAAPGNALAAALAGYNQEFFLTNGIGAYPAPNTGFLTSLTQNNLSNGYSSTASTVDVGAKVSVGSGFNLPAGAYTVNVKATVTP